MGHSYDEQLVLDAARVAARQARVVHPSIIGDSAGPRSIPSSWQWSIAEGLETPVSGLAP
jgi:hypothetical protein